ncbi:hypothetical protein [Comamonas sp.]|uniref:hypothetical protein n=1 Tax=Comamonas sp. TaxID=34028 RepID=UPI002899C36A|nr:hypothetical protein [Comamonas sp.]
MLSHTAAWSELETFCQAIAGSKGDHREVSELAAIARQAKADLGAAGTEDILATAYFFWRKFRWNEGLDAEAERSLRQGIGELERRCARERPTGA